METGESRMTLLLKPCLLDLNFYGSVPRVLIVSGRPRRCVGVERAGKA